MEPEEDQIEKAVILLNAKLLGIVLGFLSGASTMFLATNIPSAERRSARQGTLTDGWPPFTVIGVTFLGSIIGFFYAFWRAFWLAADSRRRTTKSLQNKCHSCALFLESDFCLVSLPGCNVGYFDAYRWMLVGSAPLSKMRVALVRGIAFDRCAPPCVQ